MKRRGYISPLIETQRNFELAFYGYSEGKHSRSTVRKFEASLTDQLERLLYAYTNESWHTSEYKIQEIQERKKRVLGKLPVADHVMQWGACMHVEPLLCNTYIRRSCACVKGRGTHDFVNLLRKALQDPEDTYYYVQLDAHHYFQHIRHDLMKQAIRRKIKDSKLLNFLDEIVESYHQGLPLGIKISQILANFFLYRFDWDIGKVFHILKDPEKMNYWCSRYITDCFMTCRTQAQADELAKGVDYLEKKFKQYVEDGLSLHYFRFADNMVILHKDKTFLHLVTQMAIMILARDYYIDVNMDYNVRPVYAGGIDVCGYVSFHTHRRLRKRNKVELCKDVAKWRKKGLSPEEIRIKCASRIGFASHADCKNLFRKLDINMEKRLGTVIKNRKVNIPFKGMRFDQKKMFSEIVCKAGFPEDNFKILLVDYVIEDSKVEKEDVIVEVPDGNGGTRSEKRTRAKKCLVIRYKRILNTHIQPTLDGNEEVKYEFEKERDKDGKLTGRDAEWYSYTGSTVMLEQVDNDFTKEDLPCTTVITEFANKMNKKFYKFT